MGGGVNLYSYLLRYSRSTLLAAACGLAASTFAATIDLSTVTVGRKLNNGDVATGTLCGAYYTTIAAGATVTLRDVTINGVNDDSCKWAGITCEGDATIILEGRNIIKGFNENYPGIRVFSGFTLTIKGGGSLDASSNGSAPGIGGMNSYYGKCGNIRIEGGTITATGGYLMPGIGGTPNNECGDITITKGVKSVTVTKGDDARYSIGPGNYVDSSGTVTIGGVVGAIEESPYTYSNTTVNLSDLTAETTVFNGQLITGTLSANVKVSIASRATVTLRDVTINGVNSGSCRWAGINCLGDATIILEGCNNVTGFFENYPGIHVPEGSTLTIKGDGSLNASSSVGYQGKRWAAGIGGGWGVSCGNIRIEGGTIIATGGDSAAGIGGGEGKACGDITITKGVTSVTAMKDEDASYSIGGGYSGTCGTVTIGGVVGEISQSPYTYYGNGTGGVTELPAPAFAADGKAATTEFVKGENGKWTLTTFAEMSNDALGSGVEDGQIKVYAAPTVEGLNNASPMTSGVTVKGKKSAVMTTIEVTPPGNPDSQFFKVKFGE